MRRVFFSCYNKRLFSILLVRAGFIQNSSLSWLLTYCHSIMSYTIELFLSFGSFLQLQSIKSVIFLPSHLCKNKWNKINPNNKFFSRLYCLFFIIPLFLLTVMQIYCNRLIPTHVRLAITHSVLYFSASFTPRKTM